MTTDTQAHGNFVAFLVRDKEPGDNKPTFDGRLKLPKWRRRADFRVVVS